MVKSIFEKIYFSRSQKKYAICKYVSFFEKQLCIFFTSANSSHYLMHKSIKIQLPNE